MKQSILFAGLLIAATPAISQDAVTPAVVDAEAAEHSVPVGSPSINAAAIQPYHAVWSNGPGLMEEQLTITDGGQLQHVQRGYGPLSRETINEVAVDDAYLAVAETRLLARETLASVYMRREILRALPDPAAHRVIEVAADDEGYAGLATTVGGSITSWQLRTGHPSFDGWIAGLAIAALPLEAGYTASLPTVTHLFRGSHSLTVTVTGQEIVTAGNGEQVNCWAVEAHWLDHASGDIYEPGPNGDGGTYFIAVNPGAGVPYVVQYVNASSNIVWDGVRRDPPDQS